MTKITPDHVEWAVVGRLGLLLEETPHEKFNVTQSYALFTSILCWVLQHIRIPLEKAVSQGDQNGHELYKTPLQACVRDDPWRIHVHPTSRIASIGSRSIDVPATENFEAHTAFRFLKNLRDATAHGDARNVTPFNVENFLVGFSFLCEERDKKGKTIWEGKISLLESDMRRIGIELARMYCNAIRRSAPHDQDNKFGRDARYIRETAA
jgi:hypothetical protein